MLDEPKLFISASYPRALSLTEVLEEIGGYIKEKPAHRYEIIVGSDSAGFDCHGAYRQARGQRREIFLSAAGIKTLSSHARPDLRRSHQLDYFGTGTSREAPRDAWRGYFLAGSDSH